MNYRVFEEWPDKNWERDNDINLFSQRGYWEVQIKASSKEKSIIPVILKDELNSIISFWCFTTDEEKWITPLNAPYFEPFCSSEVRISEIFEIVANYLKEKKDCDIEWITPPKFQLKINHSQDSLLKIARIKSVAVGHFLKINPHKDFSETILQKRKKRQLTYLLKTKYEVSEHHPYEWETLYEQLLHWRKSKGHENLLPANVMLESKAKFPNSYFCLQLTIKGHVAGLVFYMKTNSKSFYVYSLITDSRLDQQQISLLLWNEIYNKAKKEGITWLDLGTSMLANGKINKGLFRFKLAIGGLPTKKYTVIC